MIFGSICKLCREKGISIAKLERETGIGNGTISRWKKSSPNVKNLKTVADYLGVTVDTLISDPPETPVF